MSRNKDRFGGHTPEPAEAPQQPVEKAFDPLSFVAPTEFVERKLSRRTSNVRQRSDRN